MKQKIQTWARENIHTRRAAVLLALLVFIEGFFFVPVNTLLTIYSVESPKKSFYFATIALIASVLGSLFAYGIGFMLWKLGFEHIVHWFVSANQLAKVSDYYAQYELLAVCVIGFLPLPLKAVTISAGFFQLPLTPFVLGVFFSRAVRFFGLATLIYIWGDKIREIIDRHFKLFIFIALLGLVVSIWFLHK